MSILPEGNADGDQDLNQGQRQGTQPSGKQHDPQGPVCEYCPERLLTIDAKICSKCGKQQRGTQKHQDTSELSEHPLSGSPDLPPQGSFVCGKPTPASYNYQVFGVELNSRSNLNQGAPAGLNTSQHGGNSATDKPLISVPDYPNNAQTDTLTRNPLGSSRKVEITVSEARPDGSRKRGPHDTDADSDRTSKQVKLEQDPITPSEGDAANTNNSTSPSDSSDPVSASGNVSDPLSPVSMINVVNIIVLIDVPCMIMNNWHNNIIIMLVSLMQVEKHFPCILIHFSNPISLWCSPV